MNLYKALQRAATLLILVGVLVPLNLYLRPPAPVLALRDPCAQDPNNLIYNGSMGPEHNTPYGTAADGWNPFIFEGAAPQFRWVGNEQIDPNGSQQVYSTNTFDAGVQQTVRNLQPGGYYWVRWGYSLAAKSYDGPNVRVDSIGRKLGVDPTGGTDSHSPNIIWGPDYFDGRAALNLPAMTMVFAARSPNATIFLRAMARDGSSGENRVWMDAICMEARPDMPTATAAAPTATPVPPTATARPTSKPTTQPTTKPTNRAPTATKVPAATATVNPTNEPTLAPVIIAAMLPEETKAPDPIAIPTARYARPIASKSERPITPDSNLFTGVGFGSIFGSFVMFAFGLVLVRRRD